eukprot:CAMPEP_0171313272 /NCGR_PEP_ID=MMETSP0816-20121228/40143_1 /TAXON_ID=420281 /ORGANISM="Proboscia inermis, Strain CCAP1064/1" /LENGTH=68 /DNA_ID=CAMNT_0011800397 /DNA_START=185 /DNA_END=391 /DNA_ORIENTATION=-
MGPDFKLKKEQKKKKQTNIFNRLKEEYIIPNDCELEHLMYLDWSNLLEEDKKPKCNAYESDHWREALD